MADKNPAWRVPVRLGAKKNYDIEIGAGILEGLGVMARAALPSTARRVAVVSNPSVFALYGDRASRSLRAGEFAVTHWLMGDGERYKTLRTAERALEFLGENRLERSDAVVALGGGVVGDVAGFAAALYLRGIAFVQVPTTLLAQIDSSVGGKTGVNMRRGKNLIGSFHQPDAVVIDTDTLGTLPRRELTAGWCEAIKQGVVGGRKLFDLTRRTLADAAAGVNKSRGANHADDAQQGETGERMAELIAAQCSFKAMIVAGDEREEAGRTDHRSRRILNFGHTVAHALEAVTAYRRFRHGEAVGYGMLAAGGISVRLGLLDTSELDLVRASIRLAGRLPRADNLDENKIISALALDKKAVGGHVNWVLLERIGRARIVNGKEIPARVVRDSIRSALQQSP